MRDLLLVIDMQNDFIDGALGTAEAAAIVENVKAKIRSYPARNVVFTMDTHRENYLSTREGRYLPVEHCIRGTEGWRLRKDIISIVPDAKIYEKPTFGSIRLAVDLKTLSEHDEISIELIGLCTDICVVSNALLLHAMLPEVNITVDASCCAGVTPESHTAALQTLKACQINVINE